jgi:signal transduction histidine kinase
LPRRQDENSTDAVNRILLSSSVFRWILGWLVIMGGLVGVGRGAEDSDQVVLQLKWRHQFQFAGYYAAVQQGYYREAGLNVLLLEAKPGEDPVQAVLRGRADFGVGTSELLLERARGEPVVLLATIFQHSPLVLLTRKTEQTPDLQSLHDQPIMLEPQSAELLAYFKYEGVDPAKLHVVHHSFEVYDLIAGKVAAMSAYLTDEPFRMKQAGVDYQVFTPRSGGIDFYGDNLFTTEGQIRQFPERVRKFREASLRGWEYAMAHAEEINDYIQQNYHPKKSRAHLDYEAEQMQQLLHPGLIEIGHSNPGRWRHMAATYAEFGMMPADFDLTEFLYDPNPQPDHRWAYWSIGAASVMALIALGWVWPLYRINQKLRAAKEAAESADQAKSRYLAFMTHELRTPLNGIIGVVNLLRGSKLETAQQHNVDLLAHAAQNQLRLIDGVLDYAKLEAGVLDLDRQAVDLKSLVGEIGELFQVVAKAKGIRLAVEFSETVPPTVVTDTTRLRQILGNLLANAVKFTAKGEVKLTVAATEDVPNGRVGLQFTVVDTGIGMDAVTLNRLFTPYMQASPAVGREFGGTGLGLVIARRLAQAMGGDITVKSHWGEGSSFTVRILADRAV